MTRALRARCEHPDPEAGPFNPEAALEQVWACRAAAEECAAVLVAALRNLNPPVPWEDIAELTGMTRQAAWQRWGGGQPSHRCPQCPGCNEPYHVCPACGRIQYHGGGGRD